MKTSYGLRRILLSVLPGRLLHVLLRFWRILQRMFSKRSRKPSENPEPPVERPHIMTAASRAPGQQISLVDVSRASSHAPRLEVEAENMAQDSLTSPIEPSLHQFGATAVSWPLSPMSPSTSTASHSVLHLTPTTPWNSSRYREHAPVHLAASKIPAGPPSVLHRRQGSTPSDWQEYTHPEGQPYFVNRSHNAFNINVVTEAQIYDQQLRETVLAFADSVLEQVSAHVGENWQLNTSDVELLVDLDKEKQEYSYYFVDHKAEIIFWLDETSTSGFYMPKVSGHSHLVTHLHEHYWLHHEYFPAHHDLPKNCEQDLIATLSHSCIDLITSSTSNSWFDRSQIETILGVIQSLKNTPGSNGQRNWITARLWSEIYRARFMNFYGERNARLFRTQIAAPKQSSPILMKIVFFLLFYAPSTHLPSLQALDVDVPPFQGWQKLKESLLHDWQDWILCATVLLAVNMSFIAIFNSPDDIAAQDPAITASLVSTLCSTISIVIGLLHVRKHRPRDKAYAVDGSVYLDYAKHPTLGMRPLAIVYSLPYAFLLWGMVTFIVAVLLFAFGSNLNIISRVFIGAISLSLAGTLAWSISYFWKDELHLMDDFLDLRMKLRSFSPVKLNRRLVGAVTTRAREARAADTVTPTVLDWVRGLTKIGRRVNSTSREGV